MSGTVPPITPDSITGITGLTRRPVYFLNLNGSAQPTIVVKGDAFGHAGDHDAEVSIKWGSKLMKHVNNDLVNTKLMTPAEIQEFKTVAARTFQAGSPQHTNVADPGATYIWIKMPFVPGLTEVDFSVDKGKGEEVSVKLIKKTIVKFSDSAVWTELGKIVAVDIFNGNNDRFQVEAGPSQGKWQTPNNVLLLEGGKTPVIGLDTFDANSFGGGMSNLNTGRFNELLILTDAHHRAAFANACTRGVGARMKEELTEVTNWPDKMRKASKENKNFVSALTVTVNGPNGPVPWRIPVDTMDELFLPYAADFAQGLQTGANDLRTYLQIKVRQYNPKWVPPQVGHGQLAQGRQVLGQARPGAQAQGGYVPLRPVHVQPQPTKTIPQGILDRMAFLKWNV